MKAKDAGRLKTLRQIKAEVLKKETAKAGGEVDESALIQLIQTMKKQRLEAIALYEKGGRPELAAVEKEEIKVLETFLPEPMDDQALQAVVVKAASELGATNMKDMGKVVKAVLGEVAGQADGKRVSQAVRTHLMAK